MHPVLQIQDIVWNIFGHCCLPTRASATSDLPALARTCRAFKEPALDVLWEELLDPSPLAQCLPKASSQVDDVSRFPISATFYLIVNVFSYCSTKCYSFHRPLTQIEWGILRSYTRRIRSISDDKDALDWKSVRTFLNPRTTEPLFPNLRHLYTTQSTEIKHFLCMPFPSLSSFTVDFIDEDQDPFVLQGPLESFSKSSPNISRLSIYLSLPDAAFSNFFSSYIRQWQDLRDVDCPIIDLDLDALVHLSHMPALTQLKCTPCVGLPASDKPLVFSNLHYLKLYSASLESISRLLSRIRLPAMTEFYISVPTCPPKENFFSCLLASVQTSVIDHNIRELGVDQTFDDEQDEKVTPIVLDLEDLKPCMAFSNLRCLSINLAWHVNLTDSDLLTLASAWPHLERLHINVDFGWKTRSGITPHGLVQLLQTCRSLHRIALAIDTFGFTEFHGSRASLGLPRPPKLFINVLDSFIEAESVPAMAAVFAAIAPSSPSNFSFTAHHSAWIVRIEEKARWYDAYRRGYDTLGQHSQFSFGYRDIEPEDGDSDIPSMSDDDSESFEEGD